LKRTQHCTAQSYGMVLELITSNILHRVNKEKLATLDLLASLDLG